MIFLTKGVVSVIKVLRNFTLECYVTSQLLACLGDFFESGADRSLPALHKLSANTKLLSELGLVHSVLIFEHEALEIIFKRQFVTARTIRRGFRVTNGRN